MGVGPTNVAVEAGAEYVTKSAGFADVPRVRALRLSGAGGQIRFHLRVDGCGARFLAEFTDTIL
jgi:hypothetical protein